MRWFFKIVLPILLSCIFACEGETSSEKNSKKSTSFYEDSLSLNLNFRPYNKTTLSKEASSITSNWKAYHDFKNEIKRLNGYDIQDVLLNISTIERAVDTLQKSIPKEVDTFPVVSRINVLNTKAKFLLQLSKKQKPKLQQIKHIAEEYPLEFNALNVQLNEVFIALPDFD